MEITSVAIIDDHKLFLKSLELLIGKFPEYKVLFCSTDGLDFTQKVNPKLMPDVVLLDQNMPNMDGPATVRWIRKKYPKIKIIILSMNHNEENVVRMVLDGISGYVLKDAEIEEFKSALDLVRNDQHYFPAFVTNYLVNNTRKTQVANSNIGTEKLKAHEIEFIKLASSELTYKEIADRMCVSLRTVDGYRDQCFKKLNIRNRVGLALYAMKQNWL
jgi:DNA-binding NarL/FixJ family response regulator